MTGPIAVLSEQQLHELVRGAVAEALAGSGPAAGERRMTRDETAEHFRCSTRTVDSWLAAGAPCVRLGGRGGSPRMLASELSDWLRSRSEAESTTVEVEPVESDRIEVGYAHGLKRVPR